MRLIVLFILLSFGADAQIIRANSFYVPQPSGVTYLLDAYPNAAAAYSLRKLKASYSGLAIRIRRDSTGNAETDIGFTANGDLDTTAIKNHCRNNSCMVTTWYNQGDSTAVDFTQTTTASQPRIMTSGVIERRNGDPSIRFDISGTSDFMDVASSTAKFSFLHKSGISFVFATCQFGLVSDPNALYSLINNNNNSQTSIGYAFYYDDRASVPFNNGLISYITRGPGAVADNTANNTAITPNSLQLISNKMDNGNSTANQSNFIYVNSTNSYNNNTSTLTPSTANASFNMRLGRASNSTNFPLNGYVSELIFYSNDQSSNRTGIETNINNYYGIW